jgi:uncharacterized protein YlaI
VRRQRGFPAHITGELVDVPIRYTVCGDCGSLVASQFKERHTHSPRPTENLT